MKNENTTKLQNKLKCVFCQHLETNNLFDKTFYFFGEEVITSTSCHRKIKLFSKIYFQNKIGSERKPFSKFFFKVTICENLF